MSDDRLILGIVVALGLLAFAFPSIPATWVPICASANLTFTAHVGPHGECPSGVVRGFTREFADH